VLGPLGCRVLDCSGLVEDHHSYARQQEVIASVVSVLWLAQGLDIYKEDPRGIGVGDQDFLHLLPLSLAISALPHADLRSLIKPGW